MDDSAEQHIKGGHELVKLGRYKEAVSSFDLALIIDPDNAKVWYYRGNALRDLVRYVEAVASYDHALILDPHFSEAIGSRRIVLDNLDRLGFCNEIIEHGGIRFVRERQPNGHMAEREMTSEEIDWYDNNSINKRFERLSNTVEQLIGELKANRTKNGTNTEQTAAQQIIPAVKIYCKRPGCTHNNCDGWQLYLCDRCGKNFCHTHHLQEDHECLPDH